MEATTHGSGTGRGALVDGKTEYRVMVENLSSLIKDIVSSFVITAGALDSIDNDTNLFSLGIDSLAAYEVSSRVSSLVDIVLPPNIVFRYPSIGEIVKYVN